MGRLMEMYEEALAHKGEPRPTAKVKLVFDPPAPENRRSFKSTAELSIPSGDLDERPENWL